MSDLHGFRRFFGSNGFRSTKIRVMTLVLLRAKCKDCCFNTPLVAASVTTKQETEKDKPYSEVVVKV